MFNKSDSIETLDLGSGLTINGIIGSGPT